VERAPINETPQPDTKDPAMKDAMRKKLQRVRKRAHLVAAFAVSLTSFFWVAKGEDDIRLVCNGTKCGLNGATWIPHF
jgi:hypothetical protein